MIVSHAWLRDFVPHGLTADAVGELLSQHVATLDGMEQVRADLAPFVVGQVVHSEPIPETRLSFNRVDDGSGQLLEVVCGAPNVVVGTKYPLARVGTVVVGKGNMTIERRKIRGFTSAGMLCSAAELGIGLDADGILPLDTDAPPGTPILQVLDAGDVRLELDVLANRPDLLSQRGVARELAALTGVPLQQPPELREVPGMPEPMRGARDASAGGVTVRIDDLEGCPRYCAAVIRGVRVGPSPEWLVQRLTGVGARSINNVVDATNYALHGLGQPMHAFDLARLGGATVVVRRARDGEALTTLDGQARALDASVLVIADAERAQAVAGVMGGADSEVTEGTTDVLLEVAYFDPLRTRLGRKRAGASSDASYRFERGVDRAATLELLREGAALVVAAAGGRVEQLLDVGTAPGPLPAVRLRAARVARVLGAPVADAEIERLLAAVGFSLTREPGREAAWAVQPPAWRHDVAGEVDLVEEVARLVGFDALPDELRPFRPGTVPDHPLVVASRRVREALVAAGLLEARPLPFVQGDDASHARVANPLAEDEPHLRTSVLDTLARRAEYNLSRMTGNVRLFEIGSVFAPRAGAPLPDERLAVGLVVMGERRPAHFTEPKPPAFDAWDAKALAERAAGAAFPGRAVALAPRDADGVLWAIAVDGREVGSVRRLSLDAPVWAAPAFGVELALDTIASARVAAHGENVWAEMASAEAGTGTTPGVAGLGAAHVRFRPLPTTPAAEFDLALLVPDGVPAARVEAVLRATGGDLLEAATLFDEFRGGDVPAGQRSLAWRVVFRDPARTLRDKEVEGRRRKLLDALERELGVRPRTA
ncbi:MAG TPA: phenylalanine--tRNA ligase subunit beta [Gemmatirosa sp.]|nr:phenylalanine--tRNA ligase subunit beta [Gemmatirosa sp.]